MGDSNQIKSNHNKITNRVIMRLLASLLIVILFIIATFFALNALRRIGEDNQLMKMNKLIN